MGPLRGVTTGGAGGLASQVTFKYWPEGASHAPRLGWGSRRRERPEQRPWNSCVAGVGAAGGPCCRSRVTEGHRRGWPACHRPAWPLRDLAPPSETGDRRRAASRGVTCSPSTP